MKNLSATQDVNVVNTATNPVPVTGTVQNAENPARQAVQWRGQLTFTDSGIGHTSITIPAGKIFVVEFASFSGFNSFGGGVSSLTITVTGNLVQGGQGPASLLSRKSLYEVTGFVATSHALWILLRTSWPLACQT